MPAPRPAAVARPAGPLTLDEVRKAWDALVDEPALPATLRAVKAPRLNPNR